jgi:dTDP-4-dehydrorhamnose 3,5-epimerase
MEVTRTRVPDVLLIKPTVFGDQRGYFQESWNRKRFAEHGLDLDFVQDNHSHSTKWTLRGLHYQVKSTQGKLVRVSRGAAYDVVVDVRRGSPTFGQWVGVELSAENHEMLWVPPGFAHGFLAISEQVDFLYKCTAYYMPEHERVILWNDPELAIDWPIASGAKPQLSSRDAQGVAFSAAEYL